MYKIFIFLLGLVCFHVNAQTCCSGNVSNVWVDAFGNNYNASRFEINLQTDWRNFNPLSFNHTHIHHSAADTIMSATIYNTIFNNLGLKYFLNSKYDIQILLPYLVANGSPNNKAAFADMTIIAGRKFFLRNNLKLRFGIGVKLPTAKVNNESVSNNLTVFGSGSYEPLFILNLQKSFNSFYMKADATFRYANNNSDNFNYGSYSSQGIAAGYSLIKSQKCDTTDSTKSAKQLYIFTGFTNEIMGMQKQNNVTNTATGGLALYGNLSVIYSYKSFAVSSVFLLPIKQAWRSMQPSINYRIRTSISINF